MFLYNVAIRLYVLLVYLVAPFNEKARKLIAGRRRFFRIHQPDFNTGYIWFHCASLGEFEQARPLIEKIKSKQPDKKILLSFFSSSGYEVRKNYPLADKIIYLPFDLATNANKFFGTFNVSLAIFVKYDVWPNYLLELLNRKIPTVLTSATFRTDQFYFKWYGRFLQRLLKKMNRIYVQNTTSLEILSKNGFLNVVQCGDVRVDRVLQIKSLNERSAEVENFIGTGECFIFGSVYPNEADLIDQVITNTNYKIIIAPHNISPINIQFFLRQFPQAILMSDFVNYDDQRVLIINNIGMLNKLYRYASGVYIGGGFEKGIHNILEPGVWGVPVYFGPVFNKFPEADAFIRAKMAFSEKNLSGLAKIMCSNAKDLDLNKFKELSTKWFSSNSGATELIYRELSFYI